MKINFFGNGCCINIFRKIPAGHKSKSPVGRLRQYQLGIAGKISRIDGSVIQMQNHSALKMGLQSLLPISCWYQHRFRGNRIGISAALCQLPHPFNHIVRLFPAGHNRDQYLLKFLAGQNLIRKFCHTIQHIAEAAPEIRRLQHFITNVGRNFRFAAFIRPQPVFHSHRTFRFYNVNKSHRHSPFRLIIR